MHLLKNDKGEQPNFTFADYRQAEANPLDLYGQQKIQKAAPYRPPIIDDTPPFPVPKHHHRSPDFGIAYPYPNGNIQYPIQQPQYQHPPPIYYPAPLRRPTPFPVANQRRAQPADDGGQIVAAGEPDPGSVPLIPDRALKPGHLYQPKDSLEMYRENQLQEFRDMFPGLLGAGRVRTCVMFSFMPNLQPVGLVD